MKKQKGYIDVLKLFFAVGVVAIHTLCFAGTDTPSWLFMHAVLRLAVPFFFCVSGYFFYKSLKKEKNPISTRNKYLKRLLPPYLFWLAVNLPLVIIQYAMRGDGLKEIILKVGRGFLFYPWGALWYVLALIVAILIIVPFYQRKKLKTITIIGLVLYLIGLVFNTYYFLVDGTALQKGVDTILLITASMRNGIFEGLFFVATGMYVAKFEETKKITRRACLISFLISYVILIIEILLTKNLAHTDDHSLFISFVFVIPRLVMLLSKYNTSFKSTTFRNYSTGIYFSHRFILALLSILVFGVTERTDIAPYVFLTTLTIDVIMLAILYKINNEKINHLIS